MTFLLDNLFPLVVGGFLLAGALAFGWLKTGQRGLLIGAVVALLAAIGLIVADRVIETEEERIVDTIHQIAADVAKNDPRQLLSHIHPDATETRAQAESELPQYKLNSVRVKRNISVKLDLTEPPPEATVEFNVVVTGSDAGGMVGERQVPRFVRLRMRKDGDRWKVLNYRHADPLDGLRAP